MNLTKCFTHAPTEREGEVGLWAFQEWVEAFRMFKICSTNLSNYYSNVSFLPVRASCDKVAFKISNLGFLVVRWLGFGAFIAVAPVQQCSGN